MAGLQVNKNELDVSQIWQTYVAFNGDADKTACALDIPVNDIRDLASAENWAAKIADWNRLREGDPRESQIQINRAINYVQAHRMRSILDKVVTYLSEADGEKLVQRLTVNTKNGPELKTRALTDLVKAAEACQLMTSRALGDTVGERPPPENGTAGSNIALLVMNAMNSVQETGLDSIAVVRQQIQEECGPPAAAST